MNYTIKELQFALNKKHGFNLEVDGIMGPKTEAAIVKVKVRNNLLARPYIGPLTEKIIFGKSIPKVFNQNNFENVPWVNMLGKHMGWHEKRNNSILRRWLKSDGKTLGDPAKFPWCGDAMETAIKLTLPNEPFTGPLGQNPYWARNWTYLGDSTQLKYGAMTVFKRGSGGHIGTAVGYDPVRKLIRVRGGNQSNAITDTWIAEDRLVGYKAGMDIRKSKVKGLRVPSTYDKELPPIPIMNSSGQVISRNEA